MRQRLIAGYTPAIGGGYPRAPPPAPPLFETVHSETLRS